MKRGILPLIWAAAWLSAPALSAQTPDTLPPAASDEDYSQYEQVQFADDGARSYCYPKILDLAPQRFVSIGWDAQAPYRMQSSALGEYQGDDDPAVAEESDVRYTGGLRLTANVPVVSRNSVVWQVGANYWDVRYDLNPVFALSESAGLHARLADRGLRTLGLNTTVFKPLDAKQFLYVQAGADLNGDYTFSDFQPLRYLRYSAAVVWGKRPSDYKQWGIGLSRTYRVGELNYLPVLLFNWTSPNRKWGVETLLPARAHVRRTFSPRSLMLAGFELEGQSYRIEALSDGDNSFEIRRSELRIRLEYQRQIAGFFWVSAQTGLRNDWRFHGDELEGGRDFFRGFFGDQPYAMLNNLGNALYLNIGVHLVSP